jgi:amidase
VDALAPALARVEATLGAAQPTTAVLDSLDAMYWAFRYVQGREAWLTDGPLIERYAPPLGPGVAERFAWSKQVTDAQVTEARAFRARFRAHLAALLGTDGVLVLPTMPDIAPLRSTSRPIWRPTATGHADAVHGRAVRLSAAVDAAGRRDGAPLGIPCWGRPAATAA